MILQKALLSFLLFSCVFSPTQLTASPQAPDYLVFQGDTFPIYHLLVEEYLEKVKAESRRHLIRLKLGQGATLNCARGYQAVFVVKRDSLFLDNMLYYRELFNLQPNSLSRSKARMKVLFKERYVNGRVYANWISGNTFLPKGKELRWDGVFHTSFEKELKLTFKKGILKDQTPVQNYIDTPDGIARRQLDPVSDTLFSLISKLNWEDLYECDCDERYYINIGKKGKVNRVTMVDYKQKEIRKYWDMKDYNYCTKSILKSLKPLKFDILKQGGKAISEKIYLDLYYDVETGIIRKW